MKQFILLFLVLFSVGCYLGPTSETRGISINRVAYIDISFDKTHVYGSKHNDGEKWYLSVTMNVYDDDVRSDRDTILDIVTTLRREDSENITNLSRRAGGVYSAVQIVVYRAPRGGGLGKYTAGIVVAPDELLDDSIQPDTIVERAHFHKAPIVATGSGWTHVMMDEFNNGKFIPKKNAN